MISRTVVLWERRKTLREVRTVLSLAILSRACVSVYCNGDVRQKRSTNSYVDDLPNE